MDGNADEDASSLRGSGVKEKLGVLRSSFRGRIRLVVKSPLSPKNKGSKDTAKEDKSGPWPPPSPSEYRRRRQGVRRRGFSYVNEEPSGSLFHVFGESVCSDARLWASCRSSSDS